MCCGKVLPPAVSVLAARCCQGWGPEPGPPLLPGFTRWDRTRAGARGRETPWERLAPRDPSQPFPHRGGQHRPRRRGAGRPSGARGAVGVVSDPLHPALLCLHVPSCPWIWGPSESSAGTAWLRSEKREALLVGFARLL